MNKLISLLSLAVILGLINGSIYSKEQHLANGEIVYLELAPVDPRSLMQGDYMALNFSMGRSIQQEIAESKPHQHASSGYVIVSLDKRHVASFKALYTDQVLADNERLLRYRSRNGNVKFATNAFFFQEGHGEYYESAKYGQFRVDDDGELLLTAMYDKDLLKIGAENQPAKQDTTAADSGDQ
ncbi:putative membrane-anchored protein [Sinobacterium caligoides]|uniref:Putative membrane-anchored protein n=1 Tax=Sinobacterium caligoides TaxID=933926 RepID=A0A3N2D558_9GAMM|nr:GDYXXLXY domain-containing protein [Sinobacterium caligoides]ROR94911.1 putative membrane-anchored protein [Sinobacterium caligoides]